MTPFCFDHSPLPILGHGPGWLVADKPSGISIHNQPGHDLCTILNHYLADNEKAARAVNFDGDYGLHPVHRLDKQTSGVILLSCQRDVFNLFAQQFAQGHVVKRYMALVHGSVPRHDGWQRWQWPLTPSAAGRRNPQGKGQRRPCLTQYRLIQRSKHYSFIECRLDTGRTHQIRRHATLAGHPLVGDQRYGSLRACRYIEKNYDFKRLGLHSAHLSITLPDPKSQHVFESPELPTEMARLIGNDSYL